MTLEQARVSVGAEVEYTTLHGVKERGVITSVGHNYVFVRFSRADLGQGGQAVRPSDLRFV